MLLPTAYFYQIKTGYSMQEGGCLYLLAVNIKNVKMKKNDHWLLQILLHVIDPWPTMKLLIVKHRNNWHSLIQWRGNCPSKDKWTRECFAWDRVKFEREMRLSSRDLALCWDTLLGVLSIGRMLPLEVQETMSCRPSDDGVFVFDLLLHAQSVIGLWWQIEFNLKPMQITQTARQTVWMLDDYAKTRMRFYEK